MLKRGYIFAAAAVLGAALAGGVWAGAGSRAGGRAGTMPASAAADVVVKGNVSIQLPRGWRDVGGASSIVAQPPVVDRDASGQFQAVLSVSQDVGNKVDPVAQQAALRNALEGYNPIELPTPITVGGLTGVTFGGTFKRGTVDLRSRQYMFVVNNQVYTITFTCLNTRWGAYEGVLRASVGTFGVKP